MTRVQAWILFAVLLAFLAGVAAGLLAAGVIAEESPLSRPYANFEKKLSGELSLDSAQRDLLRKVLFEIQSSEEAVKNRHARHMEEDLSRCSRQADEWIREFVSCLTKDRQLRYEQLLRERN